MDEYTYVIIPAEQHQQQITCFTVDEWRLFGFGLLVMVGIMVVSCGVFLYFLITHHY